MKLERSGVGGGNRNSDPHWFHVTCWFYKTAETIKTSNSLKWGTRRF